MKIHWILPAVCLLLTACTKETKQERTDFSKEHDMTALADSTSPLPEIKPSGSADALRVEPVAGEAGLGKTLFTQNGQPIIVFNTDTQTGTVKLSGKEYALNQLTFSENSYEIKGDGVTLTASNGDFQEMVSDCGYGTFPEVVIKAGSQEVKINDVKVQDCPNYH